ncbi:hypothetical protein BH11PLA1_BH11PLA1_09630 [soil metagenome]
MRAISGWNIGYRGGENFVRIAAAVLCGVVGMGGVGAAGARGDGSVGFAGVVTPPALDRWMYPFGATGARATASVFTTMGSTFSGFDDRDAEYVLGFDTGAVVPAGRPWMSYRVKSVRIAARVSVGEGTPGFVFDGTSDAAGTYVAAGGAGQVEDGDAGRPIEMFACGYRGVKPGTGMPWSAANFTQDSPFATEAPEGYARGNRSVYPVDFGGGGGSGGGLAARDVSNNVTGAGGPFDARALAVGQAYLKLAGGGSEAIAAGAAVPDNAEIVFVISGSALNAGEMEYVQRGLSAGRVNLLITSLHSASDFGSGPVVYPVFATRFNPLYAGPRLEVEVRFCPADIADDQGSPLGTGGVGVGNSGVNEGDYNAFFNTFFTRQEAGSPADIADDQGNALGTGGIGVGNSGVNEGDYNLFFNSFFSGCDAI